MRRLLALVSAFAAACSTVPDEAPAEPSQEFPAFSFGSPFNKAVFIDTDGDGIPDQRKDLGPTFTDTDDDGIPDARIDRDPALVATWRADAPIRGAVAKASAQVMFAESRGQLAAALRELEAAVHSAQQRIGVR